ncbi:hypothetical protein [Rhodoligotrophos defluvii]|nr:hypothetical protein [Rhodoligotrophos defluvii]
MSQMEHDGEPISEAQRLFWLGLSIGLIIVIVAALLFFLSPVLIGVD